MPHFVTHFSLQLDIFANPSSSPAFLRVLCLLLNWSHTKFLGHWGMRIIRVSELIQNQPKTSPLSGLNVDPCESADNQWAGFGTLPAPAHKFSKLEQSITTRTKVRHSTMPHPLLKIGPFPRQHLKKDHKSSNTLRTKDSDVLIYG